MEIEWFYGLPEVQRTKFIISLYSLFQSANVSRDSIKELLEKDFIISEFEYKMRIQEKDNMAKLEEYKSRIIFLEKDKELIEMRIREILKTDFEKRIDEYKNQIIDYKNQLTSLKESVKMEYEYKINNYKLQIENIKEMTENRTKEYYNDIIQKLKQEIEELKYQNISYNSKYNEIKLMQDTQLNNIIDKINPSSNKDKGIQGEEFIKNILNEYFPYANIVSISEKSAKDGYAGDIMIIVNQIRIMIECKNISNSSLKRSPTETIERFKNELKNSKSKNMTDYGIFISYRTDDIQGKVINYENLITDKGDVGLMTLSNVSKFPERLVTAIVMLITFKGTNKQDKTLQEIISSIQIIEANNEILFRLIQQQEKGINELKSNYKNTKKEINNILQNNIPDLEKTIINIYKDMKNNGKVSKEQLVNSCMKIGIEIPKKLTIKRIETILAKSD